MKKIFFIDAGHGGMIDNKYQTALGKMWKFPDGEVAYEGVTKRSITDVLCHKFKMYDIPYVYPQSELDQTLYSRVTYANVIQSIHDNVVFLSFHSNAGGGHGFEVFTSVGDTPADPMAQIFCDGLQNDFPNIRFRTGE